MPIESCQWNWGTPQFLAIIGTGLLASCGDPLIGRVESGAVTTGSLTIHTAYALSPFTDAPMPVYLTVDNTGAEPDSLLGATTTVSTDTMLHGGGMEGMQSLVVPARGTLTLRPGETHLMLEQPLPRFARGDSVRVMLRFAGFRVADFQQNPPAQERWTSGRG